MVKLAKTAKYLGNYEQLFFQVIDAKRIGLKPRERSQIMSTLEIW